jgi:alpha-2-macroglobulin
MRPRRTTLRLIAVLCALVPLASDAQRGGTIPPLTIPVRPEPGAATPADTAGLRHRIAESTGPRELRAAPAPATMLAQADAARILARLPALPPRGEDGGFAFPARTLPPPRTGTTVLATFPSPDSLRPPPAVDRGGVVPLAVVRAAPVGEVTTAAEVVVAFSAPMVPLSSVGEVEARGVPVRLSPQTGGRWRWLDVRTAVLAAEGRLPAATEYTVTVPQGTRSASGAPLAETASWTFRTPPPRAVGGHPHGSGAARDPLILVRFDQRIDRRALLRELRVTAAGSERAVRLATPAEVERDPVGRALARAAAAAETWIAVRAVQPLPHDAVVTVTVGRGSFSAEGPLSTTAEQSWAFRTFGPLRVEEARCGWRPQDCRPRTPFQIRFSNAIDTAAFTPSLVSVEPEVPGLRVTVQGSALVVTGRTAPRTRYTVRLGAAIADVHGQRLGSDQVRSFSVRDPYPALGSLGERMIVLDPAGERRVSVTSHDHARLRVRLHRVEPEDWPAFSPGRPHDGRFAVLPGRQVVDRVVRIAAPPGETTETVIDVDEVLRGGPGHVVVAVEGMEGEGARQGTYAWVQATRIGVSAFGDADGVLAWATSLVDGAPVAGARATLDRGGTAVTGRDGTATLRPPAGDRGARYLVVEQGGDRALLPGGWSTGERWPDLLWYAVTDRNLYRPGEEVRFKGWVRRHLRTPSGGLSPAPGAEVVWTARDPRGADLASGTATLSAAGGFDALFRLPAGANLGTASVTLELAGAERSAYGGRGPGALRFQVQEFRRPEFEVAVEADEGPHVVVGSAEAAVRASYFAGGGLAGAQVTWSTVSTPAGYTPPGWGRWTFGFADAGWWGGERPAPAFARSLVGETDASGRHAVRLDFDEALPPRPYALQAQATVLDVNRQPWTASTTLLVHPAELYVGLRTERGWIRGGESLDLSLIVVDLEGGVAPGTPVEVVAERLEWRAGPSGWAQVAVDSTACSTVSGEHPVSCAFRTREEGGAYRVTARIRDARGRPSHTRTTLWAAGSAPWRMGAGWDAGNPRREVRLTPDRESYAPGDTARVLAQLPFWPARGVVTIRREGLARTLSLESDGPTATLSIPVEEADIPNLNVQVDLVGTHDASGARRATARATDYASGAATLEVTRATRTLQVLAIPADSVLTPDAPTAVSVEVRDALGRPVAGAEVALVVVDEAVLALTGYRFSNPVQLFHPAWHAGVSDTHLRPHVRVAVDTLGAPGVVRGRVIDAATRQPIAGARAEVQGTGLAAETDAAGHFRIEGVPAGRWTVRVAHGAAAVEAGVEVGVGIPPMLRIELVAAAERQELMLEGLVVTRAAADRSGVAQSLAGAPPAPPAPPPPPGEPAAGPPDAPVAVRANFEALALWSPVVRTDRDGRARVPFTLPSNLTRYRVMAVAASGTTDFGGGEAVLTARQPLMVRPSPPRFLNWGDRFELPVVVQNRTDRPLEVQVAARGDGIAFTEAGRRVLVPANDRVEVRIAAEAVRAGEARVQVVVASGALADAAEITLPVHTPATAEAFATYGSFADEPAVELPLHVPGDAIPVFGGLEVTTSSTALHELTDAFLYLVAYPFECAEQVSSRLLAVAALRDVLAEFRAAGLPPAGALADSVRRDLRLLRARQTRDGGFGFWHAGGESWPYASVHALHALVRVRQRGYEVPPDLYDGAMAYVREVERHLPPFYPRGARLAIRAYAAYVRDLAGDAAVEGELRAIFRSLGTADLPLEVAGWLLAAVADRPAFAAERSELLRLLNNRATETASTATFVTRYEEGHYLLLHSDRRTDGVVLEALLRADPRSDLVTKTVRGLLGHRTRGRWSNTQENAWILLALDRYFREYEAATPDLVAGAWLGGRFAGEHAFRGRTAERHHLEVPMATLVAERPASLVLGREGVGRLYYRAGVRYAPSDLHLAPLDRGFRVEREYEGMDDPADVTRGGDGVWRIRAGARVRVTLTMVAASRRLHVALVDPLPAGFEPLNPALRGAERDVRPAGEAAGGGRRWWWGPWFEHQNLRDDRAEAFTSLLPAGVYTYSYVARATTPGVFTAPPPRAEEMYAPETFGRGGTDRVEVVGVRE